MEERSSWQIQKAVVISLFLREMKTRFGSQKWGYLWAILEPAAFIGIFWLLFGFHARKALPGIDYPIFIMVGIIPWLLFNNIVTRSMTAFEANRGLFSYRQVKPIDTILARVLVECSIYFMVFLCFMLLGRAFEFNVSISNIPGVGLIVGELILFSFGVGLFSAVVSHFTENYQKVIRLMFRPLYFASGMFFSVETVSEKFRWMLLLNPVIHFIELIRSFYFNTFNTKHASEIYILFWTTGFLFVGLFLYTRLQNRIIAS
ncbi:MAG: ABC transporter permease [Desulfobacterales bacterium]|nr:ABC transporter permease [Desulfobacterales bacterium]